MKSTTIMIIDGDTATLDVVDFFFSEKGHTVLREQCGSAAIDTEGLTKAEVIVIDPNHPDGGGCDYVRSLRQRGISTPIVAYTSIDDPFIAQQALESGCTEVVYKPCNPQKLLLQIEKVLTKPEPR
jgi:two-component system OmpR family response regulator